MLAYVLALVVGLGSFALYMAAFFFPEVYRKNDLIWSGIGMFYALVLWVCAGRITGGLLLGETASVALITWLGWQMLLLRRQTAPVEQQTPLPSAEELQAGLSELANPENLAKLPGQVKTQFDKLRSSVSQPKPAAVPDAEPYVPLTPADFAGARQAELTTEPTEPTEPTAPMAPERVPPQPPEVAPTPIAAAEKPTREQPAREAAKPVSRAAESVAKPANKQAAQPQSGLGGIGSLFKGLIKKKESKPVYVRKQYRSPAETEAPEAETPESTRADYAVTIPPDVEVEFTVVDDEVVVDSSLPADEIVAEEMIYEAAQPSEQADLTSPEAHPQPVPPKPPSADLVEAALADAEAKHLPAHPPHLPESESSESTGTDTPEAEI